MEKVEAGFNTINPKMQRTKKQKSKQKEIFIGVETKMKNSRDDSEKSDSSPKNIKEGKLSKVEKSKDIKMKKRQRKKLTSKRKEELLRRVTLDEFGPLTEFDFSEESNTDVEPNEEIVEEVSRNYK